MGEMERGNVGHWNALHTYQRWIEVRPCHLRRDVDVVFRRVEVVGEREVPGVGEAHHGEHTMKSGDEDHQHVVGR